MKKLLFVFMILCCCCGFAQSIKLSKPTLDTAQPSDLDDIAILHFENNLTDACEFLTWNLSTGLNPFFSENAAKFGDYGLRSAGSNTNAWSFNGFSGGIDFGIGTGDFTLEYWLRASAISVFSPNAKYLFLIIDFDNYRLRMYYEKTATTTYLQPYAFVSGEELYFSNQERSSDWVHVCYERHSGVLRAYIDGVFLGASAGNLGTASINTIGFSFFRVGNVYLQFEFDIDELRISRAARYGTGNNNFTPPSAPFGKITGGKIGFKPALSGKNNRISITEAMP